MKWEVVLAWREQQQLVKDEAKGGKNPAHETPQVGKWAGVTRELRENWKMKTQVLVLRPSYRSECYFSIIYSHHSTHSFKQFKGGTRLWRAEQRKATVGQFLCFSFLISNTGYLYLPQQDWCEGSMRKAIRTGSGIWMFVRAIWMFAGVSYVLVLVCDYYELDWPTETGDVKAEALSEVLCASQQHCPWPGPPFWAPCGQHAPEEVSNSHGHEASQSVVRWLSSLYWPQGKHIPGRVIKLCFVPVEEACSRVAGF